MYADGSARGGVLEPEGIIEIKWRPKDLLKTMHRLDPHLALLTQSKADGLSGADASEQLHTWVTASQSLFTSESLRIGGQPNGCGSGTSWHIHHCK